MNQNILDYAIDIYGDYIGYNDSKEKVINDLMKFQHLDRPDAEEYSSAAFKEYVDAYSK